MPPRPPCCLSPQKIKRLPGRRAVTIALGIVCQDGIVIGADSEISGPGDLKHNESKVYHSDHPSGWSVLFTYAGDVSLYKEARSKIIKRFREREPSFDNFYGSCDEIFTAMGRHIHHPDGSHGVYLDMLFALAFPAQEPRLLVFSSTGMYVGEGIHVFGSGDAPLSQYLCDSLASSLLSSEQAVRVAVYLISRARQYTGGNRGENGRIRPSARSRAFGRFASRIAGNRSPNASERKSRSAGNCRPVKIHSH